MTENVLFMIHGVGDQGDGWSTKSQDFLREEIKKYPTFKDANDPLDGRLHFEEIVYNDVLDSLLKRWKELTDKFDSVSDGLMPDPLKSINRFIGKMAANGSQVKNNQLAKRAADVLMYRGLSLVQRLVLLKIVSQMASVISARRKAAGGAKVKFGVIAHSLGTAVAHDAMQVMASTDWLKTKTGKLRSFKGISDQQIIDVDKVLGDFPLGTGNFRFQSIYMVANTSLLLHTTKNPHRSLVRPPIGNIDGNCNAYLNINHKLDPIGMVRPFDMSKWPKARQLDLAINIRPKHIHEENIHSLSHYLLDPEVHGSIYLDLVDDFTNDDFAHALLRKNPRDQLVDDPFHQFGDKFSKQAIRDKVENRLKEEFLERLLKALAIVDRKVP